MKPSLADIRARLQHNPALAALNPHLAAPGLVPGAFPPGAGKIPPYGKTRRIRQSPHPKTKPEREMNSILSAMKEKGEIVSFTFEGVTLLVGDGLRYTPDFIITMPDGRVVCIEVKGQWINRHAGVQMFQAARGAWKNFKFELWQLSDGKWNQLV